MIGRGRERRRERGSEGWRGREREAGKKVTEIEEGELLFHTFQLELNSYCMGFLSQLALFAARVSCCKKS